MNKVLINAKCAMAIGMVCVLAAAAAQATMKPVTRYFDFSDAALSSFWKADLSSTAFASGGGMVIDANNGILRFNNVGNYAYAHIETVTTFDTTNGIRVDAIMRQDNAPVSTWGMGVGIYFNEGNSVSLKQMNAGGQYGWGHYLVENGVQTWYPGNDSIGLSGIWLISGIELTPTEIIYYGSSINPAIDQFGVGDINDNESEITEFRESRPASFTGRALIIVGKGTTNPSGGSPNPDFDNSYGNPSDTFGFCGIDLIRTKTYENDPDYCGAEGTVYLPMDFNRDCQVNFKDLAAFAADWLKCTDPQVSYCNQFWR